MMTDHIERLLTVHAVLEQISMSRSKVYQLMRAGRFPKPRMIEGKTLWLQSEVQAWIAEQVAEAPVVGTVAGRLTAENKKAA